MPACPSCTRTPLSHTLVNDSLPANGCRQCNGLLVSLVVYRAWRERNGLSGESPKAGAVPLGAPDTKDAIVCGKCRKLMMKFRISAEADNRVDYCATCDEVWLDGGEWELIESLAGSGELANITSQPWQHRITRTAVQKMALERLQEVLGDEFEKVAELRELIDKHPARLEILAYLTQNSRQMPTVDRTESK